MCLLFKKNQRECVSLSKKLCISTSLSLWGKKLEGGNPKSDTHTHTLPIPLFPEPFPSSIQPPQRNERSASSASGDDVHEEMKVSQPFWSKHPSIKLKAGLPRWVCCFYSAHIHIADTHIRSFLTHPDGEKCLSFQSGCKKKKKKKPTCHLTLWHFKSNVCFTWICNSAHFSPGVLLAYSQVDSVSVPTGC